MNLIGWLYRQNYLVPVQILALVFLASCGRTSLEHARECEAVLGPLPRFSCSDAQLIPVTKEGDGLEAGSWEPNDCDAPAAFGKPCDPGYAIGRYEGLNEDGSPNEDVVYLTNCRDGGLGVIGHKFSTGETCFMHIEMMKVDANATDIPTPDEEGYSEAWQRPKVVAKDNCQECHMAGPFLHSPAVSQLKNPMNESESLVPVTGHGPYSIVGEEFSAPLTTDISNTCTSCHRPQCTEHFQNYPLDELQMPPPFQSSTVFDHSEISEHDRQVVRDWCESLDLNTHFGRD